MAGGARLGCVALVAVAWLAGCGDGARAAADVAAAPDVVQTDQTDPPDQDDARDSAEAEETQVGDADGDGDVISAPDATEADDAGADDAPEPVDSVPDAAATDAAATDAAAPDATEHDAGPLPERPARVLFIGNSYTAVNDLPAAVAALVNGLDAGAPPLVTAMVAPGGTTLPQHLAAANDPSTALYGLLRDPAGWDVVVMHDQSQIPGFNAGDPTLLASLAALPPLVTLATEAGARVVLMLTWGRRDGDTLNPGLFPDFATMQAKLTAGYAAYAEQARTVAGARVAVAPVGTAWQAVRDGVGAPDAVTAAAHFSGLYLPDGSHPSASGTYLAAATLTRTLTGVAPSTSSAAPGVTAADKLWLDLAAAAAFDL